MFRSILLILILFFIPKYSQAVELFDTNWKFIRKVDSTESWHYKPKPGIMGSFQTSIGLNQKDFNALDKSRFFKKLERTKKKILSLIGISKWRAYSYKFTNGKHVKKILIAGSYYNAQKNKVNFIEVHFFKKGRTSQIFYSQPGKFGKKINTSIANNFISLFSQRVFNEN